MNKISLQKIKNKLDKAKEQEQSIKDKYSTNFVEWSKACDKVNRLSVKYNIALRQFAYNHIVFIT